MKYITALKRVRNRLARDNRTRPTYLTQRYICDELYYIGAGKYRQRISRQLAGARTYEGWLSAHHCSTFTHMTRILQVGIRNPFLEGRIQWLDYMIAQEEKK